MCQIKEKPEKRRTRIICEYNDNDNNNSNNTLYVHSLQKDLPQHGTRTASFIRSPQIRQVNSFGFSFSDGVPSCCSGWLDNEIYIYILVYFCIIYIYIYIYIRELDRYNNKNIYIFTFHSSLVLVQIDL